MMEPSFHFNDVHVKAHQERVKELWGASYNQDDALDMAPKGKIRTAAGNLLIRWGERVSGSERQAATHPVPGRFAS